MDEIDRKIINHLQVGFPICESPYQAVATELGLTEAILIERIKDLLKTGVLSRFGPMYHAEQMGGELTLAALKAAQDRFEEISEIVNAFPEVAHNYARNHELNMWFVIATEQSGRLLDVLQEIEEKAGVKVYNMPKIKEYFVGLRLEA